MTKEEKKNMMIANCRICLLSKYNCAECPLNWALKLIENERIDIENFVKRLQTYESILAR